MLVFLNVGKAVGTSEPEEHAVILPLELMARGSLTEQPRVLRCATELS